MRHFSQGNPFGEQGQDDLPLLLRRVADSVEIIEGANVMDLVLHHPVNEHGTWYQITVYYSLPGDRESWPEGSY